MTESSICTLVIAGLSVWGFGCDAAVRGTQDITLTVKRVNGGTPASGARVRCAPASIRCAGGPSETIARYGSEVVTTATDGGATIRLHTASACGGRVLLLSPPKVPSRPRDEVTGKEYLFEIADETAREILTLSVERGATVKGARFLLAIATIGEPQPLPPDP